MPASLKPKGTRLTWVRRGTGCQASSSMCSSGTCSALAVSPTTPGDMLALSASRCYNYPSYPGTIRVTAGYTLPLPASHCHHPPHAATVRVTRPLPLPSPASSFHLRLSMLHSAIICAHMSFDRPTLPSAALYYLRPPRIPLPSPDLWTMRPCRYNRTVTEFYNLTLLDPA